MPSSFRSRRQLRTGKDESHVRGSVLLVDDEPNIVKTVKIGLESAGFGSVKWSNRLDFKGKTDQGANTIYYRATNGR